MALRGILWRKIQKKRVKLKKKKKVVKKPVPKKPAPEKPASHKSSAMKIRYVTYRGGHLLYPPSRLPPSNMGELLITDSEIIFQKKSLFRRKEQWRMTMALKRIDFKELEKRFGPTFYVIPFIDEAGVKQSPSFSIGSTREAKKLGGFIHQKIASLRKIG